MLVPKSVLEERHIDARSGLCDQFNSKLEDILNANKEHDKYWILGKVKFPKRLGGKVGRVFLEACLEQPPLVTDAFLYEVDSRRGVKTLLWVMNPGNELTIPGLNKTIKINKSGE